jgi:glycosyltransferase involved in cell wall biosynthesis
MKLAIVVQRYGADISGGAELHARQVAEHLARHADVTVLTTCARDYITWRNEFPPGRDQVNGVTIERFPVARERDPLTFGRWSDLVFTRPHSLDDEIAWLESMGPLSTDLIARMERSGEEFDYALFFSVRYYHAYHGTRAMPGRSVLVPTAEREPSLGVSIFGSVFRDVRAIMYNSPEERALIQSVSRNHDTPGVVVGVGVDLDIQADAARFRAAFGIDRPYVIYIGRIDHNKGFPELLNYYRSYVGTTGDAPLLLLIGTPVMEIPKHSHIRHLGFVTDEQKFDALAGAETLIMPSYFESLSMVMLEAWSLGRAVLANGRCDVLMGQCVRSNGGLYYRNGEEFCGALDALLNQPGLAATLGSNGRLYCEHHYAWPVIERKYRDMLERLDAEGDHGRRQRSETVPGWWVRGRRTLLPAASVVNAAQSGPVRHSGELAL